MGYINSTNQPLKTRSKLLVFSLVLSLLLHSVPIIGLYFFAPQQDKPERQPTFVRLIEKPIAEVVQTPSTKEKEENKDFEIDEIPLKETPQVKSPRKAKANQKVLKEQAPKGKDARDESVISQPPAPIVPQRPLPQQPEKPVDHKESDQKHKQPQETKSQPDGRQAPVVTSEATEPQSPAPPLLSPQQLLPDRQTLDRIVGANPGNENRVKQRDDVEIGDTVWLNLEHDLLVSFFRRFHDQIERVWNYPKEALQNQEEGTLLLLITVDRKGELIDVDLLRSSGSDLLDFEAIQAVYRAAPFGPLSKHYPHERLNIRAHFHYEIAGKYIYGRQ